jgi:two-component sensor histidine kinase
MQGAGTGTGRKGAFSMLAIYIILSGWVGIAVYFFLLLEIREAPQILSHFLSTEHSGIRFRALVFFAPFISTVIGFLVNERERFIRKTMASGEKLDSMNEELAANNERLEKEIEERRGAEEKLKASLTEKEALLGEVHNRVKNNMQLISSLLNLQSRYIGEEGDTALFTESRNRIRSMALVHENIYQTGKLAAIEFREYVKSLGQSLLKSFRVDTGRIALRSEVESVSMDTDTAIYCGLIINELLTNSLKHAFPEAAGEIRVSFRQAGEEYELSVGDNGVGMPAQLDLSEADTMGLGLVKSLAEGQLEGRIELDRDGGTEFRIFFRVPGM